jgi:hypothetical protein
MVALLAVDDMYNLQEYNILMPFYMGFLTARINLPCTADC